MNKWTFGLILLGLLALVGCSDESESTTSLAEVTVEVENKITSKYKMNCEEVVNNVYRCINQEAICYGFSGGGITCKFKKGGNCEAGNCRLPEYGD